MPVTSACTSAQDAHGPGVAGVNVIEASAKHVENVVVSVAHASALRRRARSSRFSRGYPAAALSSAAAQPRPRQRMRAAAVFMLVGRFGQRSRRESGARRVWAQTGDSWASSKNFKVPCAAGRTQTRSNHLLERPLLIRRRRRRRPLAGPERRDLRPQRRVLALQRTSLKSQRREVAARSQGGPLINRRRHLVPRAVQALRPLGPPQVPRRPRATDRHGMRRRA